MSARTGGATVDRPVAAGAVTGGTDTWVDQRGVTQTGLLAGRACKVVHAANGVTTITYGDDLTCHGALADNTANGDRGELLNTGYQHIRVNAAFAVGVVVSPATGGVGKYEESATTGASASLNVATLAEASSADDDLVLALMHGQMIVNGTGGGG